MNLKEDYPSPDGSCNDQHEPSYYEPTTTGSDQQHHHLHHHQLLQWQYPSDEQPPHVLVYDSLDRPTPENCLLPTILGKCQVWIARIRHTEFIGIYKLNINNTYKVTTIYGLCKSNTSLFSIINTYLVSSLMT